MERERTLRPGEDLALAFLRGTTQRANPFPDHRLVQRKVLAAEQPVPWRKQREGRDPTRNSNAATPQVAPRSAVPAPLRYRFLIKPRHGRRYTYPLPVWQKSAHNSPRLMTLEETSADQNPARLRCEGLNLYAAL